MDEVQLAEISRAVIREEISGIKHDLVILKQELAALKAEVD